MVASKTFLHKNKFLVPVRTVM